MGMVYHAAGVITVLVIASGIAVFGFGLAEVTGPVGSFGINVLLAAAISGAAAIGFGVAASRKRRSPRNSHVYALGVLVGLVLSLVTWFGAPSVGLASALALALLLSSALSYVFHRLAV